MNEHIVRTCKVRDESGAVDYEGLFHGFYERADTKDGRNGCGDRIREKTRNPDPAHERRKKAARDVAIDERQAKKLYKSS